MKNIYLFLITLLLISPNIQGQDWANLKRFQEENAKIAAPAKGEKRVVFKVVVILAGTNDIAGNTGPSTLEMIENNLASMAELAKANGIKVILCSVLPAYDYPWRKGLEPAEKIIKLNQWIEQYAKKNKMIYLNYYSSFADERKGMKAEYSGDGVHPNKAGYKIMIPLVEAAIKKAL